VNQIAATVSPTAAMAGPFTGQASMIQLSTCSGTDGVHTPPTRRRTLMSRLSVSLHVDDWIIDACPVNGPAIAAVGDTVAAIWFTGARDTAKVQLVFSTDAGATFGPPVRIDGGVPAGRVDVELLDGGDAVVTWIERTAKDSSEVRARLVRRDGSAAPPLTVSKLPPGRATGFPRMTRLGDGVALAWTIPGTTAGSSTIQLAELRVAPR
jgi:hypothetical protein